MNVALNYSELFREWQPKLPGQQLDWLAKERQLGLDYFTSHGFPKASDEPWKYTHLESFLRADFAPALYDANSISKAQLAPFTIADFPCYQLVFINGWLHSGLSDIAPLAAIGCTPLSQSFDKALVQETVATPPQDSLVALNTAFMADGMALNIPEGKLLDKPIHLLFLTLPGNKPYATHSRCIIRAGAGSHATIVETHAALGKGVYWSNNVTHVALAPNATVQHYKLQNESAESCHIGTTLATLDKHSNYTNFTLNIGGKIARNAIHTNIIGERAECHLNGAFLGSGNQLLDHYLPVVHNATHSTSHQHYKGVLSGQSQGVFYGKIIVPPKAIKTDAHQLNQNLILSQGATIYSRPELEIDTDDVQCSHGSATGDMDEDALFYLRSRGIAENDARNLLIEGFVDDVLESISQDTIKQHLHNAMHDWLVNHLEVR